MPNIYTNSRDIYICIIPFITDTKMFHIMSKGQRILLVIMVINIAMGLVLPISMAKSYGENSFDPVYKFAYTYRDGRDHGYTCSVYVTVWGWYFRGSNYFYASQHEGTVFGDVDGLVIKYVRLKGRALLNGVIVNSNSISDRPNDYYWSGDFSLNFDSADRAQTRIIVKYRHGSHVFWVWTNYDDTEVTI